MVATTELVQHLDRELSCAAFSDYCPNGLQVEGAAEVTSIVSGVTASQSLIDAAIAVKADAILVHHGYFWRGEDVRLVGMKKRRVESLLHNDINLLAYHLPLDCHPVLGNNIQLAHRLGIDVEAVDDVPPPLIRRGRFAEPLTAAALVTRIESTLQRVPLHVAPEQSASDQVISSVAWCTGAAQGEIDTALAMGVDAYITGEISEQTVHVARENNIHFFAAGHHATERYGVQALGEHLADRFELEHRFIDCDNPA